MLLQLRNVASHRAPSLDLSQVIRMPPPRIISAIPLEPSAGIVRVNPSFLPPDFKRLRCVHAEVIERSSPPILREVRAREPARWKFLTTIGHVFPAEHSQRQHLFRRQLRVESRPKFASHRLRPPIDVAFLHFVSHQHTNRLHSFILCERADAATKSSETKHSSRLFWFTPSLKLTTPASLPRRRA